LAGGKSGQRSLDRAAQRSVAIREAAMLDVGPQAIRCFPVVLYGNDAGSPARKRLDSERTRSGEQIENIGPEDCAPVLQYAKGGFTEPSAAGAYLESGRNRQLSSARLASYHTHRLDPG
jgi:hypothetical protein